MMQVVELIDYYEDYQCSAIPLQMWDAKNVLNVIEESAFYNLLLKFGPFEFLEASDHWIFWNPT